MDRGCLWSLWRRVLAAALLQSWLADRGELLVRALFRADQSDTKGDNLVIRRLAHGCELRRDLPFLMRTRHDTVTAPSEGWPVQSARRAARTASCRLAGGNRRAPTPEGSRRKSG